MSNVYKTNSCPRFHLFASLYPVVHTVPEAMSCLGVVCQCQSPSRDFRCHVKNRHTVAFAATHKCKINTARYHSLSLRSESRDSSDDLADFAVVICESLIINDNKFCSSRVTIFKSRGQQPFCKLEVAACQLVTIHGDRTNGRSSSYSDGPQSARVKRCSKLWSTG